MSGARAPQRFVLASASPRRRELLSQLGLLFDVDAAHLDETPHEHEAPAAYVERLARERADAVAGKHPGRIVLAADTTVALAGEILGKPADRADAERMLRLLSGTQHRVLTAVGVQLESLGKVRCVFAQEIRREDEVLARARVTVACVSGEAMKPTEIPEPLRRKMEAAT